MADAKTVRDLISGVKYSIDYYQREYKWDKKHIIELLEDLESKFRIDYDKNHDRSNVEGYGHYYLGSIVITNKSGVNFIIDGQQRLTTLTLLFIYFRNLLNEQDRNDIVDFEALIFSKKYGRKSFNIEDTEDSSRRECMEALYNNDQNYTGEGTSETIRNIINRYDDIVEIFPESLKEKALPYFIDWLMDNVELVQITTFSDDDAYTVFETMNDRGLSLKPTEMLKGYLLMKIMTRQDRDRANVLWKKRVLALKDLGREEEDSHFLKAWLRAKYAETIRERKKGAKNKDFEKIGSEFHKWVRNNKKRLELKSSSDFLDFIIKKFEKFSRYYIKIDEAAENFTPGLEYVYFNASNNFTLQNTIIFAPLKDTDDEKTILKKIKLVSGYIDIFINRRVVNRRTLSYSSILYTIFNLIKEIRDLDLHELATTLKRKCNEMNETFEEIWNFSLHTQNKRRVHHILARMTYHIEKGSGIESDFETFISREIKKPFEIEHIWGKKFEQHSDEFSDEKGFLEYRQYIGNLVLIPRGFNQSLGADTYENKVEAYFGQNLLAKSLNKLAYKKNPSFKSFIKESNLPFRPHTEFKKEDLDTRQELYREICERIWSLDRFDRILED